MEGALKNDGSWLVFVVIALVIGLFAARPLNIDGAGDKLSALRQTQEACNEAYAFDLELGSTDYAKLRQLEDPDACTFVDQINKGKPYGFK